MCNKAAAVLGWSCMKSNAEQQLLKSISDETVDGGRLHPPKKPNPWQINRCILRD